MELYLMAHEIIRKDTEAGLGDQKKEKEIRQQRMWSRAPHNTLGDNSCHKCWTTGPLG